VDAISGGRSVSLGGPRQRTLLALLLLRRGEPVPSDQLIDELWGEAPPGTAPAALQNHVARLRRALGDARVVTRASGYAIALEPGELDLARFDALVERSRAVDPATRSTLLAEALALWRGTPLEGLSEVPAIAAERSRLEELRLAALEARIDADLELGHEAELVVELSSLAVSHPRREGHSRRLMLVLYRSGRQVEALDVYRDMRRVLAHDLGLEPSESLRALYLAMLRRDPRLELRPTPAEPVAAAERPMPRGRRLPAALVAALVLAVTASAAYTLVQPREGHAARPAPRGWSAHRDSFDESDADPSIWQERSSGSGSSLALVHGHLEIRFMPAARVGGSHAQVGRKLGTVCTFPGDFDAQVAFRLVRWPASNGVIVGLWALGGSFAAVYRVSDDPPGNFYAGRIEHQDLVWPNVYDDTGTIRLTRRNGLVTTAFLQMGQWETLERGPLAGPVHVAIGAVSDAAGTESPFAHKLTIVALDDFAVVTPSATCPPGSKLPGA
jgi:DNA-binding SARP family transcriptional activator